MKQVELGFMKSPGLLGSLGSTDVEIISKN